MKATTINTYSLNYSELKTYLLVGIFTLGNLLLPQLIHQIPQGGFRFLPILFFTLIASYKYGWRVGILTAVLSPVVNHLLFGMPTVAMLTPVVIKSVLLAVAAAWIAERTKKVSIPLLLLVVMCYQIPYTLIEMSLFSNWQMALHTLQLAIPGMILQILGGYYIIKYLLSN